MRTSPRLAAALACAALLAPSTVSAQAKKPLTIDDYTKWRSIDNAALSADGSWAVYGMRQSNTLPTDGKPVVTLRNLRTSQDTEIPHASQPQFSPDGKWLSYLVEPPPPARGGRGNDSSAATPSANAPAATTPPAAPPAQPPTAGRGATPPRRWEVRELATGKTSAWQDVQSAQFSPTSTHLFLRRRPQGTGPAAQRGVDALLVELASGRSQFLGSVGESAFNKKGDLFAYTVDAAVRDGNGLYAIDLQSNLSTVLDNDSLRYARLTWNDAGSAIAVLKGREVERQRERDNRLVVVPAPGSDEPAVRFATADAPNFPKGFVISERAPLAFSDDGARVYLGIIPQTAMPDTGRRRSTDSVPDVDVWRTADDRIQSQQMIQSETDRNRTFRQAVDIASRRFIALSDSTLRDLELPTYGEWGVGRDARAYVSDWKQAQADFYRVNLRTGERTPLLKAQLVGAHVNGISANGRTFLYWNNTRWHSVDLATGTTKTLAAPVTFTDAEEDHPGIKPAYGVGGYTPDGNNVIVYNRFDAWLLPLDGSAARNVTQGAGARDQIVYRIVRTTPIDSSAVRAARVQREVDLSKPVTFSLYGEYTKKSGFARLDGSQLTTLVLSDALYSTPQRATQSDTYLFTRQTFTEFPDLQVAGAALADARKISNANPQHREYTWGRRELFNYTTRRGVKLQGILAIPDDYVAGEKRPMLVTFYEKNSQGMHRYTAPSYITGMGAMPVEALSRGYITMLPDVHFHTGSSHTDMLDAVEAATAKVISMGYVDPKRIGVHGHSYGGEGAAFIATRSKMFAAVGMGAGVTDLFTDFSQSWGWSYQVTGGSGQNGNAYYMFGQGRWGFSPWERPEVYHFESALTHVPRVVAPVLIMHGTADPTVGFPEGMNFYNALRFNGKDAIMLAYPNEGHGLRGLANRRDLTIRYFQFFDHYLKQAPAPKWMTHGVPYNVKADLREPKY
jgi:dipeptidyl aminopeptidase/acylaminoacyl peptidase